MHGKSPYTLHSMTTPQQKPYVACFGLNPKNKYIEKFGIYVRTTAGH